MSLPSAYKPSPLGHGSPQSAAAARSSPFRRAETPASPSPLRFFTVTPNGSPSKTDAADQTKSTNSISSTSTAVAGTSTSPVTSTSRGTRASTGSAILDLGIGKIDTGTRAVSGSGAGLGTSTGFRSTSASYTTTNTNTNTNINTAAAPWAARPTTPTTPGAVTPDSTKRGLESKMVTSPRRPPSSGWGASSKTLAGGNALSQLQPAQVRTLRDGFQILDRDCDGVVTRDDVADMLNQLGLPSSPTDVGIFFPSSKPQTLTLAAFLNSLAETLAVLSPSSELMSAFSTFDDDDSGQVDWAELKEALLSTPPEAGQRALSAAEVDKVVEGYTGRRAFNRNMNAHLAARRGEVFRYQEFVNALTGANGGSGGSHQGSEEQ